MRLLRLASLLFLVAHPLSAQRVGLIVVAHGADSTWNASVRQTVNEVRWTAGPVKLAFLMGSEATTASWDNAVVALQNDGVERIVAVPFMVSTHGSHVRQVEFFAGIRKELPTELRAMMGGHDHAAHVPARVPVTVTGALDNAPELGEALAARWNSLDASDRKRPLMLIAHGPNATEDARLWERDLTDVSGDLARRLAPHPVRVGLLRDDAGEAIRSQSVREFREMIATMSAEAKDSVLVMPVLISTGAINYQKLPADIEGLPVRYSPVGLTPSTALARWVERIALESLHSTQTHQH